MALSIPDTIQCRDLGIELSATSSMRRAGRQASCNLVLIIGTLFSLISPHNAHASSFTIVALPDTQNYAESSTIPAQQTQWIVDNLSARNIAFVTHLGDVVDIASQAGRWTNISNAMALLDDHVPYSVAQGNHDADPPSQGACPCTIFLSHFGDARYLGFNWYGGKMPPAERSTFYQYFEADGVRFLHLGLELFYVSNGVIEWARGIIAANPGLPVIVSTHAYLDVGEYGVFGSTLWTNFINTEPQIFMVLNGHYLEPTDPPGDAEFSQISTNNAGLPVIEMLANYQQRANGGDGWLRIIEVDRATSQVHFSTYSPSLDLFETDADSEFTLSFDLAARLSQCNDGIDNDFDGLIDFPAETECEGYAGLSEGVAMVSGLTPQIAFLLAVLLAAFISIAVPVDGK